MQIYITCPAFSPNGGIRVILEIANRLNKFHQVTIFNQNNETKCSWFPINCRVTNLTHELQNADLLIISSPHAINLASLKLKAKVIAFIQMMEHLFHPYDLNFKAKANKFYTNYETIIISQWGMNEILKLGNRNKIHYLGNGVNFDHFPISKAKKDNKTILLESPVASNATKDVKKLALKVAHRLRDRYKIIGFGQVAPNDFGDNFVVCPDLKTMNKLYKEATVMVKATLYDFRSTAPLEAATKGTVTARAIMKGDDDLVDMVNCRRVPYNEDELYRATCWLMENTEKRTELASNFLNLIKEKTWDYYVEEFRKICER